jgi:hypothetical protein
MVRVNGLGLAAEHADLVPPQHRPAKPPLVRPVVTAFAGATPTSVRLPFTIGTAGVQR